MRIKLTLSDELIRINTINEQVKHISQPTGNSCGPTCIKMVGDFILGDVGKIDDICNTCGTDWVVGTPPDRMEIGLKQLGINYIIHQSEIEPFQSIKNTIDKGNVAIVRTITEGVPHWINIVGYFDDDFEVHDPWKGPIRYNEEELNSIWEVRDFFYYEIVSRAPTILKDIKIRPMVMNDYEIIKPHLAEIFSRTGLPEDRIVELLGDINLRLSVVADVNGDVAGFYFLNDEDIPEGGELYDEFEDLKGLEGVALGVIPDYLQLGVGKKLIEYSRSQSVDYIWGYQFKSLKNIDDWLKRRKIYWENDGLYITYEML